MAKKKVLLMGKAHSGKTSMRSIIFANYLARDTMRLSPTLDVEHHHVRFLGDLVLNLWDCGGQDAFYESYFERDRETIFRSVELLIYVFDIESDCPEKDFEHFAGVLEAIEENSPDARIFVLVHKMDLVAEEERLEILEERRVLIDTTCRSCGLMQFQCFGTSIWDETLYKAWSEIVTNLIPNLSLLESHLDDFCRICDADEVVLFERATFLVISHSQADKSETHSKQSKIVTPTSKENQETTLTLSEDSNEKNESSLPENPLITGDNNTPSNSESNEQKKKKIDAQVEKHLRTAAAHFDAHRFEKISNIVKQFKLSCGKAQSQFQGMEVRNSCFAAYIDAFTAHTYIMVIVSNPTDPNVCTAWNIRNARRHFEYFFQK